MMRPRLTAASPRAAIVAVALTAVVMSACTSSGTPSAPSAPRARADEPVDEGLAEEIAEQQEGIDERTEALEEATAAARLAFSKLSAETPRPAGPASGS
jgi:hypothetical protein